jgi:hypothetical protein
MPIDRKAYYQKSVRNFRPENINKTKAYSEHWNDSNNLIIFLKHNTRGIYYHFLLQ